MVAKLTSRNGWDKLPETAADADCFLFLLIVGRAFWRQNMANIDNNGYCMLAEVWREFRRKYQPQLVLAPMTPFFHEFR